MSLSAQEPPGRSIVAEGFKRLSHEGPAAALSVWLRQSRGLDNARGERNLAELKKIQATLGDCTGFDILRFYPLGGRSSVVAASAHFRYGAVFFRFLVFQDSLGQQYVNGITFSTDPLEAFPARLSTLRELSGEGR